MKHVQWPMPRFKSRSAGLLENYLSSSVAICGLRHLRVEKLLWVPDRSSATNCNFKAFVWAASMDVRSKGHLIEEGMTARHPSGGPLTLTKSRLGSERKVVGCRKCRWRGTVHPGQLHSRLPHVSDGSLSG